MTSWKFLVVAMGMAWMAHAGLLGAGEPGAGGSYPDAIVSMRRNAAVTIGGEVRVDYSYRSSSSSGSASRHDAEYGDLSIRHANLRIMADVHPNVRAHFKLNLGANSDEFRDKDEIMEEALLVVRATAGSGLELYAGKGRAPYGQDITLGMVQSYAHAANHADSVEGRVFIIEPPATVYADPEKPGRSVSLPPMRPGQFDRTFMAGVAYEWNAKWRVELAAFQPNTYEYRPRIRSIGGYEGRGGASVGAAGRIWWSPVEDLVLQASAMVARSGALGRAANRLDVAADARTRKNAYAVSLGFDWHNGPWRVFGEYQKGWDWNFTRDYDTASWQLGLSRDLGAGWRLGAMGETLRIRDPYGSGTDDDYYKLVVNMRYEFSTGLFILAEYGHEWFRRESGGRLAEKRRGHMFGMRLGFSF